MKGDMKLPQCQYCLNGATWPESAIAANDNLRCGFRERKIIADALIRVVVNVHFVVFLLAAKHT